MCGHTEVECGYWSPPSDHKVGKDYKRRVTAKNWNIGDLKCDDSKRVIKQMSRHD